MDFLLQSQNADGGWGYRIAGMSYVEPTAAVMRVLPSSSARNAARDFLLRAQHADGGWGIAVADSESGWMTAWAVRALAELPEAHDAARRGGVWLLATEGQRITDPDARRVIQKLHKIDSALGGWPWQPGDAGWVHPTALAVLALVAVGQGEQARVRAGIAYLEDRACSEGGWNIGNPWMLDKQIPATIQDTAVVLRALHAAGETRSAGRVAQAIEYLRNAVARAQTPAELAWGIYALRDWGMGTGDALARLEALQQSNGSWNDNPFITAIASQK